MDSLVFVICLFINILQILLLLYLYKRYWKKHESSNLFLLKIFLYVNLYKHIFNGIIVDVLRILSGGEINKEYGVSSTEILQVISTDFISNFIYYLAFTFFLLSFKSKPLNNALSLNKQIKILIFISILSSVNLLFSQIFLQRLWLFKNALYFMGPICAIMTTILGVKYNNKIWVVMGLIPLIIVISLTLISGLRGSIVGISICFIILAIIEIDKEKVKKILLIGILPLVLLAVIQEKMSTLKYAFVVAVSNGTIDRKSVV